MCLRIHKYMKKPVEILASKKMVVTFFCKRDRHTECPGEWPIGELCGSDYDCSFDIKMRECECNCHKGIRNVKE
jgi:hypothetical protein